jgi:hypothetical protein
MNGRSVFVKDLRLLNSDSTLIFCGSHTLDPFTENADTKALQPTSFIAYESVHEKDRHY